MGYGVQAALCVKTLRSACEGEGAAQEAYGKVLRHLHFRFVERELTAIADAFFQQKTDI